jgi:hypothetical protein
MIPLFIVADAVRDQDVTNPVGDSKGGFGQATRLAKAIHLPSDGTLARGPRREG